MGERKQSWLEDGVALCNDYRVSWETKNSKQRHEQLREELEFTGNLQ